MSHRRGLSALMLAAVLLGASSQAWSAAGGAANTPDDLEAGIGPGQRTTPTEKKSPSQIDLLQTLQSIVQSGPVDPKTYVLGPGDVLELDLWGKLSRSILLPVSPEGTIFLPGSGSLMVAGRTLTSSLRVVVVVVVALAALAPRLAVNSSVAEPSVARFASFTRSG